MIKKISSLDDRIAIIEKLESKTIHEDFNNCWIYDAKPNNTGYVGILIGNYKFSVHRVSAYLYLDFDIFSKEQINHKKNCKNKRCWNPIHLYIGNQSENMQDAYSTNKISANLLKTHCKYGHEFSKENTIIDGNQRTCRECKNARQRLGYALK